MNLYATNVLAAEPWLKVSKEGNTSFKVNADPHWSRRARTGTLRVQTDKGSPQQVKEIKVTQAAAAVQNWAVTTGANPTTNVSGQGTNPGLPASAVKFTASVQTNGGYVKLAGAKGVAADKVKVSKTADGTAIVAGPDGFYEVGYTDMGLLFLTFEIPANGTISAKDFGVTVQAYGEKADTAHADLEVLWRQSAAAAYLTLDPATVNNIAAADNADKHTVHTVSVQTNAGTISLPADIATAYPWLSFSVDQAQRTINVFAKTANTATNVRSATVTVTAGTQTAQLTVTQLAAGAFLVNLNNTAVAATATSVPLQFSTNLRQLRLSGLTEGSTVAVGGKGITPADGVYTVGDGAVVTVVVNLKVPANTTVEEKSWQVTASENKADSPQTATSTNKQLAGAPTLAVSPAGELAFDADGTVSGESTAKDITVTVTSNTDWSVTAN